MTGAGPQQCGGINTNRGADAAVGGPFGRGVLCRLRVSRAPEVSPDPKGAPEAGHQKPVSRKTCFCLRVWISGSASRPRDDKVGVRAVNHPQDLWPQNIKSSGCRLVGSERRPTFRGTLGSAGSKNERRISVCCRHNPADARGGCRLRLLAHEPAGSAGRAGARALGSRHGPRGGCFRSAQRRRDRVRTRLVFEPLRP
jgi:hypothetical protein